MTQLFSPSRLRNGVVKVFDSKQSEYENPWVTEMVNLNNKVGPTTTHALSDGEPQLEEPPLSPNDSDSIYTHESSLSGDEWQDVQPETRSHGAYVTPALSDDSGYTLGYKWPVEETQKAYLTPGTPNDDSGHTTGSRHVEEIRRPSTSGSDMGPESDDRHVDESVWRTSIPRVMSIPTPIADTNAAMPVPYDDQEVQRIRSKILLPLPPANVIVFGESGVGKSSIINMLVGKPVATVSNQAAGCTFASKKFQATIDDREVMLYDTAGLDEAVAGTVSPEKAIGNLRSLVMELTTVNLLVYVIRGTRFRKIVSDNYHIFRDMIHGGDYKVPVVLVITGLENEDNMDDWWEDNKAYLAQYKLTFRGHACITATKGRAFRDGSGYIFEDLYNDSRKKVMKLLADHAFNSTTTIAPLPNDSIIHKVLFSLGVALLGISQVTGYFF